jgi:hypothetical protein
MKHRLPLSVLLAAGLSLAAALLRAADPSAVPPAGKNRLTERIDALLRPHLKPAPLPVMLPNPFVAVRGTADLTDAHDPAAPGTAYLAPPADDSLPSTDAETLARCMARLKIGGTMQVSDVTQLTINQELYKEGDYVALEGKGGALLYVQIARLTPEELTFRYKDATQVVRLKYPSKPKDPQP